MVSVPEASFSSRDWTTPVVGGSKFLVWTELPWALPPVPPGSTLVFLPQVAAYGFWSLRSSLVSNLNQSLMQETLSPTTNAYANPSSKMVIRGGDKVERLCLSEGFG